MWFLLCILLVDLGKLWHCLRASGWFSLEPLHSRQNWRWQHLWLQHGWRSCRQVWRLRLWALGQVSRRRCILLCKMGNITCWCFVLVWQYSLLLKKDQSSFGTALDLSLIKYEMKKYLKFKIWIYNFIEIWYE